MATVSLPVFDASGQKVGAYDVDSEQIASRISKQLLHDVVVMYEANARQGTFRTKNRGEVAGSTKKMYRQKGTGNARAGSRRAGQRRGGGHIFAKRPRDFSYRLPKKAVRLACRMAIRSKIDDEQLIIVDGVSFDSPKTSQMAGLLKALGLTGESVLLATESYSPTVYLSARNIPKVDVLPASDLNAYVVLKPKRMIVTKAALDDIVARASGKVSETEDTTGEE